LSQNVQALTFTGITLLDILEKDAFHGFLQFYNKTIASMIE